MIPVALFGYGYWGRTLARNIADSERLYLAAVVEPDSDRYAESVRRYGAGIKFTAGELLRPVFNSRSFNNLLGNVEAVVIATPPVTHYDLVATAIRAGLHVLVAKPLTLNPNDARWLAATAAGAERVLMVDHTFLYQPAVRKMLDLRQRLGGPLVYNSVRANLGRTVRDDVDVVWDLAAHDFAILHALQGPPEAVQATGVRHSDGQVAEAHIVCWYNGEPLANIHVSWLSPVKVRRITLRGPSAMLVYDDMEATEKVRLYEYGPHGKPTDYRAGDVWSPHVDNEEALKVELDEFADAVNHGVVSALSSSALSVAVVDALAATAQALHSGAKVHVPQHDGRR